MTNTQSAHMHFMQSNTLCIKTFFIFLCRAVIYHFHVVKNIPLRSGGFTSCKHIWIVIFVPKTGANNAQVEVRKFMLNKSNCSHMGTYPYLGKL